MFRIPGFPPWITLVVAYTEFDISWDGQWDKLISLRLNNFCQNWVVSKVMGNQTRLFKFLWKTRIFCHENLRILAYLSEGCMLLEHWTNLSSVSIDYIQFLQNMKNRTWKDVQLGSIYINVVSWEFMERKLNLLRL